MKEWSVILILLGDLITSTRKKKKTRTPSVIGKDVPILLARKEKQWSFLLFANCVGFEMSIDLYNL